jgi:UrcA family protein
MTNSAKRQIWASVLSIGLAAGTSCALAGPLPMSPLEPAVTIRLSDLNTATVGGGLVLYGRIKEAARSVCSAGGGSWYPSQYWAGDACYRATVDRVVAKLNLPQLTAVHLAYMHREAAASSLQASRRSP